MHRVQCGIQSVWLETTHRNEPLFPKKKPRAKSLSDRQVILQMTAGKGVFFFVTERTDIGMQKPMIHMNLNQQT